ncbi:MAG TPA: AAA family ATPase [Thermomicrobiales bacterium]|nr:AAA family ATPase [Thermomicrobiales bacterium]
MIAAGRHNEILRNELLDLSRRPAEFAELQRILQTYFGGQLGQVRFNDLLDQFVTVEYAEPSVNHDLYSVGAGFIQVLQLLSFILGRSPGVILLDEPDAHLHSSLQKTVVDVLDDLSRSRQMQVVLSTHSKEIINYVDPSRLVLIEKGADRAASIGETATQLTILQSLGEIDNVDAYALVRNRRCLFVEGVSDIAIVERLAARLGLAVFAGDDRVVVIPTSGADRFEHVQQLTVFEGVLGGAIASFEIRDRDGRTEGERTRIQAGAPRPLHILDLDCIESYLINPTVLARVIASVSAERGGSAAPTGDEIEAIAMEIADSMKEEVTDRIADRYARDRLRETRQYPPAAESNGAARDLVDANWNDLAHRLRVLPGKTFLGRLRERLQADFGVSFGNPRLVEEFAQEEVPAELADLLKQVASQIGGTPPAVGGTAASAAGHTPTPARGASLPGEPSRAPDLTPTE